MTLSTFFLFLNLGGGDMGVSSVVILPIVLMYYSFFKKLYFIIKKIKAHKGITGTGGGPWWNII